MGLPVSTLLEIFDHTCAFSSRILKEERTDTEKSVLSLDAANTHECFMGAIFNSICGCGMWRAEVRRRLIYIYIACKRFQGFEMSEMESGVQTCGAGCFSSRHIYLDF